MLFADYDGDHFITTYDIEQATAALTRNELGPEEIAVVCDKVLEEANNDDDGKVSLAEFQQVITRAPDFLRYATERCQSLSNTSYLFTVLSTFESEQRRLKSRMIILFIQKVNCDVPFGCLDSLTPLYQKSSRASVRKSWQTCKANIIVRCLCHRA